MTLAIDTLDTGELQPRLPDAGALRVGMTMRHRAAGFARTFPKSPASWPRVTRESGRDVLYAIWLLGNDYRNKSQYYGAYPPGFLSRILTLFPWSEYDLLHAFSGALPPGPYLRLDVNPTLEPDVVGSVYDAAAVLAHRWFGLVIADPPYSKEDAKRYGTPSVDKRRAIAALADVTRPGGHLVWLDTCWPMHNKTQWVTVGRIVLIRSTNHRVRLVSIFERVGTPPASRFEVPPSESSRREGDRTVREYRGLHSIDTAWPWWRPR